ncbi:DNA-binding response regulator [Stenotrophomonas maltophilia]|uniref:response regulator n=1 Tax=Stenotrophomonas maltophilia TaxID=40324 RepID=UPI000B4E6AF9|nr:response regulator transcription factor [Stenotrophomonas maltophilia]MPS45272.1 response regulator transcription factor [Stenotrophomonas sp.]MBA0382265.1 DNA-binding response regulator [Stenotrophomonas maltophilia]OWQ82361.1 DNA-binding response regulator [Stenotrophomonas maltophilia]PJL00307.1 DNA-binding response regulator [Stenotrophomonas maltophilia]QPX92289.1 response regulator transcription factor [Stenotrophomonas maltophilia]
MRILLVEDDLSLGEGIRTALRRGAFAVDWVQDGNAAVLAAEDGEFDLMVLDLGLPRVDGIEVIRRVRAAGNTVPILVLSARERATDRTLGLDVGADDYLGKPFDTPELLARVRALVRRSSGRAQPALDAGGLHLDPATLEARWKGRPLDLTRREFALLRLLMEQNGRPMARDTIQKHLYGWDEDVASNAVDVHVHQLRRKVHASIVRTVRGIGYALGSASETSE